MNAMTGKNRPSGDVRPCGEVARGLGGVLPRLRAGAVAAAALVEKTARQRDGYDPALPRLGVVLGTGLGVLADCLDDAWSMPARDTGWLAASTATGHAGRLVGGTLGGRGTESGESQRCELVMLQGRVHGYEGHAPELLSRGVELLAALGVTTVLLTNAAGGLRPDMRVGELLILNDHIDLVRRPWAEGLGSATGETAMPVGMRADSVAACYDPLLVAGALDAARSAGAAARAGVYAHLMGPSYETRAEYRMLRKFGADVVGMSTVPEAIVARWLGLRVAAVSVVTNVARPDAPACTDAEDVCRAAAAAAEGVRAILARVAALIGNKFETDHRSEGRSP
jgi:purine-nucleoside phosphorylase